MRPVVQIYFLYGIGNLQVHDDPVTFGSMKVYGGMDGRLTISNWNKGILRFIITGINICIFIKKIIRVTPAAPCITAQIKYLIPCYKNFPDHVIDFSRCFLDLISASRAEKNNTGNKNPTNQFRYL